MNSAVTFLILSFNLAVDKIGILIVFSFLKESTNASYSKFNSLFSAFGNSDNNSLRFGLNSSYNASNASDIAIWLGPRLLQSSGIYNELLLKRYNNEFTSLSSL